MTSSLPASVGLLGQWPLPTLLLHALDHKLHGRIVLTERNNTEHTIALSRGGIVGVETRFEAASVGQLLVRMGAIDQARYAATTRALGGEDDSYGDQLVAMSAVTTQDLYAARAERIVELASSLVARLPES